MTEIRNFFSIHGIFKSGQWFLSLFIIQVLGIFSLFIQPTAQAQTLNSAMLEKYAQQLSKFDQEFRMKDIPDVEFFLFGMGNRTKILYKD